MPQTLVTGAGGQQPGDELLTRIRVGVIELEEDMVDGLVREALRTGIDPLDIEEAGLRPGLDEVGRRFEAGEEFLPGLMLSARIMQSAVQVLRPYLQRRSGPPTTRGTVVLGTVAGDLHDIGKNLVGIMLEMNNFRVHDLGVDVPSQRFVEAVGDLHPEVLAMSALISTTLGSQRTVIADLAKVGLRQQVKIVIGGAATTPLWAQSIGADAYGKTAVDAVAVVKELLGI
jgi:corrinoid protein of di/trimethylamine methyltransferase